MRICVLGTAAGGGLPQWNCRCDQCQSARAKTISPRLHSSIALSAAGSQWFIINATPDVTRQIESCRPLQPRVGMRSSPIAGVVLTDAELDHCTGLLSLRQDSSLKIFATESVLNTLSDEFPVKQINSQYARHDWIRIEPSQSRLIDDDAMLLTAIAVGTKLPRFTKGAKRAEHAVIACLIEDLNTGAKLVYAPTVEVWSAELESALADANCILIDGTFASEHEMQSVGNERSAFQFGHIPLNSANGVCARIAQSKAKYKFLTHINNTNPILLDNSTERNRLEICGVTIPSDFTELTI